MISRCYATAICSETGLLDVVFPTLSNEFERKNKEKQLKLITNTTKIENFKQKVINNNLKNRWKKSENAKNKNEVKFFL